MFIFCFKDRHGNWIRDGWWVLAGLLVFIVVEKLFSLTNDDESDDTNVVYTRINTVNNNHKDQRKESKSDSSILGKEKNHIKVSYLLIKILFVLLRLIFYLNLYGSDKRLFKFVC